MDETLIFFILKRISDDGPLSSSELQRRAKPIHALLDLLATRKGKPSLASLPAVLRQLLSEGWLQVEPPADKQPESKLKYSLTPFAEQRLNQEFARRQSMLSRFVEDGELEKSFGNFLRHTGSPAGN